MNVTTVWVCKNCGEVNSVPAVMVHPENWDRTCLECGSGNLEKCGEFSPNSPNVEEQKKEIEKRLTKENGL